MDTSITCYMLQHNCDMMEFVNSITAAKCYPFYTFIGLLQSPAKVIGVSFLGVALEFARFGTLFIPNWATVGRTLLLEAVGGSANLCNLKDVPRRVLTTGLDLNPIENVWAGGLEKKMLKKEGDHIKSHTPDSISPLTAANMSD
ncbi:10129_t:CDS:2 [Ambispora gerdemannii]|uniref:10129_t:CDS:1 n=1 Tax=Ambispora gerdemannii TaxID=144530 RepID=A0A9N8V130_9GLOM|nr:10129_t:CDS:2 [Ambispora gerdemannii]